MSKVVGITSLLEERGKTHGQSYDELASCSQSLKEIMRDTRNWQNCSDAQRESLDMIAVKICRILSGDHNFLDHWKDIAGYANLIIRLVDVGEKGQP